MLFRSGGLPKNSFIKTQKNNKKYVSVHLSDIKDTSDQNIGNVLIIRDISKIVENEQKAIKELDQMTNMFFELPIGMIIMDKDLKIINSNQSFTEMFGLSNLEIVGSVLGDAINCVWSFEKGCGLGMHCMYCKLREQIKAYIQMGKPFKNFMTEIKDRKSVV